MKKQLVASLAAAMVLGLAGTAFAASNPFVDVPAKHWSYDSVTKLAQAGIVDGYGDGTFRGDKTMTRYEMAQIVAKAMARSDKADAKQKAEIDKLAVEFATELEGLNVRVSKLEKNASKIKIEGESRLRYSWNDSSNTLGATAADGTAAYDWRQRLHLSAQVTPDIKYTGRMEATGTMGAAASATTFNRNFFTISNKLGMDQILVGKMGLYNGKFLAVGKSSNNDGVAINTKVGALDLNAFWTAQAANTDFKGIYLSKTNKNFDFGVGYLAADATAGSTAKDAFQPGTLGWNTAATASTALDFGTWIGLTSHVNFVGEYVKTDAENAVDGNAYAAQLSYTTGKTPIKAFFSTKDIVNKANAHEQGVAVSYRSVETNGLPAKGAYGQFGSIHSTSFGSASQDNVKGWYVGYQNVLQKNVLLNVEYQDLKVESTGADLNKTATAYVQFYF